MKSVAMKIACFLYRTVTYHTNGDLDPQQNATFSWPLCSIILATMVASPAFIFPRSLPQAPNVDISQIKGNVTDEQKQLEVNVLFYFVSTPEKSYGADIGQRLKVVEINVWNKDGPAMYGETIFEIVVEKG